ncbi:hypothetical protein [Actinoallomurus rhizosphaericola]|uniref:hypothetical protein n=1 Tax=Actinoallomurus rhizosphaericola TaxID=2952536 RepID=UPI00209359DD|nr:hypothetical protein [Actinoallomurus rhizosphaericola]MCO5996122.1 hypothetical protein [Actinoallomurus rhizosphaericola]
MSELQGEMFGGALKGDAPVDDASDYSAEEIRDIALAMQPSAVSKSGQAWLDFQKALLRGPKGDSVDLLDFIQKIGADLNNAWCGPKSGAPEAQQQLVMLYQSIQALSDAAAGLGYSVQGHADNHIKPFQAYFQKDGDKPSPFYNDAGDATFKKAGTVLLADDKPGADGKFKYYNQDGWNFSATDSQADAQTRATIDAVARNKLNEHIQNVKSTYEALPGWLTLTLPPGTLPPDKTTSFDKPGDKVNPDPTQNPGSHPKVPYSPTATGPSSHNGSPSSYSTPNFSTSPNGHSGSGGNTSLLGGGTHGSGSTNLSGLPTGTDPNLPPTSNPYSPGGNPSTNPSFPSTNPTGTPPTNLPVGLPTPTGDLPNTKLPKGSDYKLPSEKAGGFSEKSPFGGVGSKGVIGSGEGPVTYGNGGRMQNAGLTSEAATAARAEQAAAMEGATAARAGNMMPYPMGAAGGAAPHQQGEHQRQAWMNEDEDTWVGNAGDSPIGGDGVIRSV